MSEIDKLKHIAELVDYSFNRTDLRTTIKSFSKLPKMLGIASLLNANGCKYFDESSTITVETPAGKFVFPKDGFSDGYRFQKAITDKTVGGNGMICLPSIDGVMVNVPPAEKWAFKQEWDTRVIKDAMALFGGDFMTTADDHLDADDEFLELDLTPDTYYYNVVLSNRDARVFAEKNPGMNLYPCSGPCMRRPHQHAVSGKYLGAEVRGVACAPPFDLHPRWADFPTLNPHNEVVVDNAVEGVAGILQQLDNAVQGAAQEQQAAALAAQEARGAPKADTSGVEALKALLEDPDTSWPSVKSLYNEPKTAKWASAALKVASKSGQKKIREKWAAAYESEILPFLEGDGTPLKKVLEKVWESDKEPAKIFANYVMRRLVTGDLVHQAENGNLFIEN